MGSPYAVRRGGSPYAERRDSTSPKSLFNNPLDVSGGSAGGGTTKLGPPAPKIVKVRAHTRTIKPKPAPAPAANTQSVRPAQVSTVKRFAPNYKGEPIAGYTSGIRNLDRSWKKPGEKASPGAYQADRPYFTDAYTSSYHAGPTGDESTQWNAAQVARAKKIQVANYGKPGYIARSLIPGGLNEVAPSSTTQALGRAANVGSMLLPGGGVGEAAGVLGFGLKALRGARAGRAAKDVAEAAPVVEAAAPAAAHTTEAAAAVRAAMPGAKILRGKQEAGYSTERSKRVAAGQVHLDNPNLTPDQAFARAQAELRGELPKINFVGLGDLNETTLHEAQTTIREHPHLTFFQKITARNALVDALGGKVPTRSEITLLEHVFGKETTGSLAELAGHPARQALLNALNIPRSLMASFDLSAPFRQGLVVATRHPTIFAKNFGPMIKAFGSEKVYHGMVDEIRARPSYPLMVEAKLPITELGRDVGGREEQFASNYAETLTGGKYSPVRASGRAYTGFLDKTRADVFDHLIERAQSQGINVQDQKFLQSLGTYIGSATGRGQLRHFEQAAPALNALFFSPRLMASRFNFLNPAYYARLDPFARKEALRSAVQLAGTASTLLALASQVPGVRVITDPRNPDWGKIRIGNTRIDIGGGFQQQLRAMAQLVSGVAISSTTGKRMSLTAGGFGQPTRLDIAERFLMGKESPILSLVTDWMRGSTQIGQKFSWRSEAAQRVTPLLAQSSLELYKEKHGGMNGLAAAFAGYGVGSVGFGVQTYGPAKPKLSPADYSRDSGSSGGSPYSSQSGSSGGSPYSKR